MKTVNLAYFTLVDYFRRTFFYSELILIAILVFLFRDGFRLLGSSQVFPALGAFSAVLATVTTLRITNLETNARIYIPLTKSLSRNNYLAGKLLAILAFDSIILLILFILAYFLTGMKHEFLFIVGLFKLVPLVVIIIISGTIMLCCSALVSSKTAFFWGLILLILGLAQPWRPAAFVLPPINQLISSSFLALHIWTIAQDLLAFVYVIFFYNLAVYLFSKRELNYESK